MHKAAQAGKLDVLTHLVDVLKMEVDPKDDVRARRRGPGSSRESRRESRHARR